MTEQRPSKDLVSRLRRGEACIDAGHRCRSMDANAGCICAQTADEIERLGQSLATANANHERFEREWYLRGDEIERLQAEVTEVSEQYTNYHDWAQDEIERRTSEYWKAEHLAGNAEIERLQHKIDTCGLQCSVTLKSLVAENDRLRTALAGIQSCSTCEACRGAATLALGDDRLQRIEALLDAEPGTPAGVELNRFVDEQVQSEAGWLGEPCKHPWDKVGINGSGHPYCACGVVLTKEPAWRDVPEPPKLMSTVEVLREVEEVLIELGWHKDRGVLKRVTDCLDEDANGSPVQGG